MAVQFNVLGAVEASIDGRLVALGTARQKCVLVALLVDANECVPGEVLIERVWGDVAPQQAQNSLESDLSRLQQILAAVDDAGIIRRPGGYKLSVEPAAVDLHCFAELLTQARACSDDVRAHALFEQALGLWRGEAFAMLDSVWLTTLRSALHEQRFAAELDHTDVRLRLGHHGALLTGLSGRAREHPFDERLSGQLMLALHQSGRTSDALAHCEASRRLLASQLDVHSSTELQRIYDQIMAPAGPPTGPATGTVNPGTVVPRQLPAAPALFTGRTTELQQLSAALPTGDVPQCATSVWAIDGPGGVGKTSLALRWAHEHQQFFPDGQLYVNLRGFGPSAVAVDPAAALRDFLDALGVAPQQIPAGLDAQTGLFRSALAGKRVLLMLDNARDAQQVRPLLPGTTGCLVLVTSRNRLTGLVAVDGAQPLSLDLLSTSEAHDLLAGRIGAGRIEAEPAAVNEIAARCARLPLALAIVAARAVSHPEFSLAGLAGELRDCAGGLDAFEVHDGATDVRTVFSWSYRALSAEAATVFRLLSLHPGPDLTASAAASLAALPAGRLRRLLAELTGSHLLTEHVPGRYTCHDLLRAYATELTGLHDTDEDRSAAIHRLLDHYLHTGHAAATVLLFPFRDAVDLARPQPGVIIDRFSNHDQALAWLTAEHAVLHAAFEQANAAGFGKHTWQLAWILAIYLLRQARWHEQVTIQNTALQAARRIDDWTGQYITHSGLAWAALKLGRPDDAETHYRQVLDACTHLDDPAGQASAYHGLSCVLEQRGDLTEALVHAQNALNHYQDAGHQIGRAAAQNAVGWLHAQLGDHARAVAICHEALAQHPELEPRDADAAATWDSLGYAYRGLADYAQSANAYRQAIDLYQRLGHRYSEGDGLASLGDTHHSAGNLDDARDAWKHALYILDELQHPDADRLRDKLRSHETSTTITEPDAHRTSPQPREHLTVTCTRHGQRWRVEYGNRTAALPNSVGMLHLAVLIANPNHDIPAIELATGVAALHQAALNTPTQPVLDQDAIRDYRDRISQLREHIDFLESRNQPDRATQARTEHDWLVGELASATAISGRVRSFPDNPERARVAVTRAIHRALTNITQADAHIGEHLRNSIHTGMRCSYRPA